MSNLELLDNILNDYAKKLSAAVGEKEILNSFYSCIDKISPGAAGAIKRVSGELENTVLSWGDVTGDDSPAVEWANGDYRFLVYSSSISEVVSRTLETVVIITSIRIQLYDKERSAELAIKDTLTGLYSNIYMRDSLEREILRANRDNSQIGMIIYDIDDISTINTNFGGDAGNRILIIFAGMLISTFRGNDISCRISGNRFMQILPGATLRDCLIKAEEVLEEMRQLDFSYGDNRIDQVTVSAGISAFPDHGVTPDSILQALDSAIYRAKKAGKDQVMVAEKIS